MTFTVTIANPEYNYTSGVTGLSTTVPVSNAVIRHTFDAASTLILFIKHDVLSKYDLETDDTNNPIQLNSTVELKRGAAFWFRGYVKGKPVTRSFEEGNYIEIYCEGYDGVLLDTVCPYGGEYVWTMESSVYTLASPIPLKHCDDYGSYVGSTLWPDPSDATGLKMYIQDADSNSDTLDGAIGVGLYAISALNQVGKWFETLDNVPSEFFPGTHFDVTGSTGNDGEYTVVTAVWLVAATRVTVAEIIPDGTVDGGMSQGNIALSTSDKGFMPRGWVKIVDVVNGDEWVYYDGYDDAEVDGKYRLRNCVRGQLGTAAVAHSAALTVYNKLAKQIAPRLYTIENDPGTGYVEITFGTDYTIAAREGCFVLRESWLGTYRGTYSVYDEDLVLDPGGTIYSISDVIKRIVKGTAANGGAGFVDGDINFDTMPLPLNVNRYDYDAKSKPEYAWPTIIDLISVVALENDLKFWWNHSTGKFRLAILANDTPAITLSGVRRIQKETSLESVYSGWLIRYTDDQTGNMLDIVRSYHPAGDGVGARPDYWLRAWPATDFWNDYGNHDTSNADGNWGMEYVVDGEARTRLAAVYDHDPGANPITFGDFWFGAGTTPPSINLSKIVIRVVNARAIEGFSRTRHNDKYEWVVRVQGCNDYNTTTHTGTFINIFEARNRPHPEGSSNEAECTSFPIQYVNAVRIQFVYMAGPKEDGDHYWGTVHDLIVEGNIAKYVFVQTSATVKDDPLYVYGPGSHTKLRGGVKCWGTAGTPRVGFKDIGAATEGAAISLGRTLVKTGLQLYQQRQYQYDGVLPAKPELGDTVEIDEDGDSVIDYTGVIRDYTIMIRPPNEGGVSTQLTVLDYSAAVIE